MTSQPTRAQLEDILGEAGACSDPDCSCKRDAAIAREELEELSDAPLPSEVPA